MADTEREDKAGERRLLGAFNRRDDVSGRLFPHTLKGHQAFRGQPIKISRRLDEPLFSKQIDELFTHTVNPHRAAAGKVKNRKLHLGRAEKTACAARVFLLLIADCRGAADRAGLRHLEFHGSLRTPVLHHADDFWNHVTGAADHNGIPYPEIKLMNEVFVMQRGVRHIRAAYKDRLQAGNRCETPGAAHLHIDPKNLRKSFFRRILVRAGPARFAGDKTKAPLKIKPVHLVNHAINPEGERISDLRDVEMEGFKLFRRVADAPCVRDREPEALQPFKRTLLAFRKGTCFR